MRGRSIFALIAAAFATVIACTPKEEIPAVETRISTATTSLDRKGGSMFVSVQASGDWTLEILFKDGSTPWATLPLSCSEGKNRADAYPGRGILLGRRKLFINP